MPIKNITDRGERFPEIGQIRKGAPKSERAPGKDLDYFRVEFDNQETEVKDIFKAVYGERPQELNVFLAFDEVEKVWDAYLEAYTAGRLVARSDGERYLYRVNTDTGEILVKNGEPFMAYQEGEIVGYWFNEQKKKKEPIFCKPVGRLRVVIPELKRLAYLTVLTTSIHDIVNISAQINALAVINGKRIAGVPLVLRRRPKEISTPKPGGGRARYTKWLVSIEASPQWVGAKLDNMAMLSLPEGATRYLPAGETVVKANGPDSSEPRAEYVPQQEDEWEPPEDVQDGDFEDMPMEEPEPQPAKKASVKNPMDPNGHTRPYEPEVLKVKMAGLIEHYEAKIAAGEANSKDSDDFVITSHIESVWMGQKDAEQKRHAVLNYLVGEPSTKKLSAAQKLALKYWLKITKDDSGDWVHCKEAGIEAVKAYEASLVAQGQGKLAI